MAEPNETREDTRTQIVEAAAALLRDQGAAAVTTRGVADAAGVQAPTIYRLFGDKDGLLDAVAETVMERHVLLKESSTETDPIESLRSGWRAQIEFSLANPELMRLLTAREHRSPALEAGIEVLRDRIRGIAAAGLLTVSPERALGMIHAAGTGVTQTLLALPPDERDFGISDALFDAVIAAITVTDATPPSSAIPLTNALAAAVPDLPGLSQSERSLLAEWLNRSVRSAES
ncbi:AcrR family transcriptional regulator [Leifsonia sp. AK011]|uniref:TetR/AcrR family transcriptional regulator n=1 Tax=Leifsonia sp. AK011 TaxID=2723075 RepID=UPI0015CD0140|nr:TetR/AcrR family transcriptional regulator [Leifsonia sp. AK011]NYF09932.1 AcrR family transcriptional regulator [Leifsonia sp. AK011]